MLQLQTSWKTWGFSCFVLDLEKSDWYENLFKICGFGIANVIKLEDVGYYDQYIYVLKKNK